MSSAVHSAPPPDLAVRAKPPSPRRLSRKVLLTGTLAIGAVVALALILGLSKRPDRRGAEAEAVSASAPAPESIQGASDQYNVADLEPPRDMLWGDHAPPAAALEPPENTNWTGRAGAGSSAAQGPPAPDPQSIARSAPIFFGDGEGTNIQRPGGVAASGPRSGFLNAQRDGEDRLDAQLTPPRSNYELMAGAVIPAALSTELNSNLPGRVIAQVTANVYDSVTGEHLLIPQGARLLGTYDSASSYGDQRLLLAWNRIVLPNGWSINLRGMEASDPSGAAGLRDRVDQHLGRLTGAIGLSAIISVIANESESDDEESLGRSVGDAAAQEAARTGGRIVDRELSVRPTLRVRAGAPVRVLVTRDIELRPYVAPGTR
jgi:type IV secretion system protein VirB10